MIFYEKFKRNQTADNLAKAFAGESQARNRYTFYAELANQDGHKQIEAIFLETADNEKAHAKVFYDLLITGLGHNQINVDAYYPIGFGDTKKNLLYAAEGEHEEWGTAYPGFAKIAKEEGFPDVETAFNHILKTEENHEKRYRDLLSRLENNTLYKSGTTQYWKCRNCGFIYDGLEAPMACPSCNHPQGYFEIMYDTRA